jgi:hypothetical protein
MDLYGQVNATEPAFYPHIVFIMIIKIHGFYFSIVR